MMKAIMTANSSLKRASYEPPCALHEPAKRSKSVGHPVCNSPIPAAPNDRAEYHVCRNLQPSPGTVVMEMEPEEDFADWTTKQTVAKDLRRRSSFMAGRSDCTSAALQSNDLCKNIPESLPPFHRLKELHKVAIEFALSRCIRDIHGNSQEFILLAKESMSDLLASFNADDLETVAVQRISPKTSDPKLEASIKMMEADLERYTAESNAWHETLKECKSSAEQAGSRLKGDLVLHHVPKLSSEQNRFLNSRPNYQEKLNNLSTLIETITVNEKAFSETVLYLKQSSSNCQSMLGKYDENLYHQIFEKSPSPRKLIEACHSSAVNS